MGVVSSFGDSRVLLLMAHRSLIWVGVFSVESFKGFLQKNPRYSKRVPLGDKKFVFDIPFHITCDVAELEMSRLSKSEFWKYS